MDAVEVVPDDRPRGRERNRVSLTGFGTFREASPAPPNRAQPARGETVRDPQDLRPAVLRECEVQDYVKTPKSMPKAGPLLARASASSAPVAAARETGCQACDEGHDRCQTHGRDPQEGHGHQAAPVAKKATRSQRRDPRRPTGRVGDGHRLAEAVPVRASDRAVWQRGVMASTLIIHGAPPRR